MLLPERVERGVLLPVVAAAVPERVENVCRCPWFSKCVEDLLARAQNQTTTTGFWERFQGGIHLLNPVERGLTQ